MPTPVKNSGRGLERQETALFETIAGLENSFLGPLISFSRQRALLHPRWLIISRGLSNYGPHLYQVIGRLLGGPEISR